MGFDTPKPMGHGATGGVMAAPIARDFFKVALADKPATPFRVPTGIKLIRVDLKTGLRAGAGGGILEAFKPGTAPPDSLPALSFDPNNPNNAPGGGGISQDSDRAVRSGTGGLY